MNQDAPCCAPRYFRYQSSCICPLICWYSSFTLTPTNLRRRCCSATSAHCGDSECSSRKSTPADVHFISFRYWQTGETTSFRRAKSTHFRSCRKWYHIGRFHAMANIAVGHYRNVSHQPVCTDRKRPNVETDTCFPQPPSFGHDNLSDRIDAAYSVRERKRSFRLPALLRPPTQNPAQLGWATSPLPALRNPGGATSPLPPTPTRSRTNRPKSNHSQTNTITSPKVHHSRSPSPVDFYRPSRIQQILHVVVPMASDTCMVLACR